MSAVGTLVASQGVQLEVNILLTVSPQHTQRKYSVIEVEKNVLLSILRNRPRKKTQRLINGHYGSEVVELMEKYSSSCIERARDIVFFFSYSKKPFVQHKPNCACVCVHVCVY